MINKGAETLPGKDAHAYKQLAKFYDAKNYKKGLKNAEKLLETHPDHPQTLSLKALFLQALGEQKKSIEVAKLALIKSKMKSMFCWHTCGSIYKTKKDFFQASKCFQNALRLEPDNMSLMREGACLHIQVRDHANHVATRLAILKNKPGLIQNWVSFTLSHHLRGDFPSLFKALNSLHNLILTTEIKPVEKAHYYLYRVVAFKDAQDWEGMYQELKKNKAQIKDEVMYHEYLYEAALNLDKKNQAAQALDILLKKFPENDQYLKQYQNLNQLSNREVFTRSQELFKSKIAKIYELCYVEDPVQFKKLFSALIKPYYQRNLISLYSEIQAIYNAGKETLIEDIFNQYHTSLEKDVYPDGTEAVSPSEYLWSMYILAQHYSRHFQTLPTALIFIDKALEHTCTVTEFYLVKADIQYKMHNNIESLQTINQARKTDLADRYMNNICIKYLMKCQQTDIAETVLRMFMRDDSLYDLQNQWYIIEAGKGFLKKRNFEAGLRHLEFINKQFLDFLANQYDFHAYCCRRWTLREYTELIAFNDNIYDDKKYAEASGMAIRYLKEYVHKLEEDEHKKKEEDTNEEKQSKKKKKKKKKGAEEVTQENPFEVFRNKIDYYGKEYSERVKKNPMEQALVWAKNVSTIKYTNKGNHYENKLFGQAFEQAIDVFIHFKKPLLVLRCLNKLKRAKYCPFAIHFAILKAIIYFEQYLKDPKGNDIAKDCLKEFMEKTLSGLSVDQYNEQEISQWRKTVTDDYKHLIEVKEKQAGLILKSNSVREDLIKLYQKQLVSLSESETISMEDLKLVFYYTHKLEFYGRLEEELKIKLNDKLTGKTTYFSSWRQNISKLPETTWTMWWLSDYDIEREEEQVKAQREKEQELAKEKK